MDAMTFSDFRANMSRTLDKVCDDCMPTIVTRVGARPIVFMSLEDYQDRLEVLTRGSVNRSISVE